MQLTDRALDLDWGVAPNCKYGDIDGRTVWWTHYQIAVEAIRESIAAVPVGGTSLSSWKDLLIDNIQLTVARSDSNREALEYFRLINDDRFRQSLSLADVWRAEVISKVTTKAAEDIRVINEGAGPPEADPLGIDGGQGMLWPSGLSLSHWNGGVYSDEDARNQGHFGPRTETRKER